MEIRRIPWRRNVPRRMLLAGVAGGIVAYLPASMFLLGLFHWFGLPLGPAAVFGSLLGQAAVLAPVLICLWFSAPAGHAAAKLGMRCPTRSDLLTALAGFGVILFGSALLTRLWQFGLEALKIPFSENQGICLFAATLTGTEFAVLTLIVAGVVPFVEEIFFRRALYGVLRPFGAWFALLTCALLFSCVHFFLLGLPGLFLMGLVFQLAYLKTRNLFTPIMIHSLVNLWAMLTVLIVEWWGLLPKA